VVIGAMITCFDFVHKKSGIVWAKRRVGESAKRARGKGAAIGAWVKSEHADPRFGSLGCNTFLGWVCSVEIRILLAADFRRWTQIYRNGQDAGCTVGDENSEVRFRVGKRMAYNCAAQAGR